jgi:hypothetical protein
MYSFDEIAALTAKIRWMATELLGDRVSNIMVEARDRAYTIGLGAISPGGWRHAVDGNTVEVIADPEKWTRAACTAIIARLDKKAAPPEQPGTV